MALQPERAEAVLHDAAHESLDQAHHVAVVGVGLVGLEHGELRVVGPVHALVPEVVADLVDPLEPAHQQPLEVELVRDPEVQRHVERVVVGHERPRRGATVEWLQDRGLDLQEPLLVQVAADPAHRARAKPEDLAHLGMHGQIGVALAVADLGVLQAAEGGGPIVPGAGLPAGQRPQRLGEQGQHVPRAR